MKEKLTRNPHQLIKPTLLLKSKQVFPRTLSTLKVTGSSTFKVDRETFPECFGVMIYNDFDGENWPGKISQGNLPILAGRGGGFGVGISGNWLGQYFSAQ